MRLLFIFGTRPEAIKLAPLINRCKLDKDIKLTICSTGQHKQMLDQVLDIFKIKPDIEFHIMKHNQTLGYLSAELLGRLGEVILDNKPHWVIVQGDTTTVMCASLASFYSRIPLAHVEAGLRTNNKHSPYPEEMNRKIADYLSDIYFAPTINAKKNLLKEGVQEDLIHVTGNTIVDALKDVSENILIKSKAEDFPELLGVDFKKKIIFVTGHRRESFGEGFENICSGLKYIAMKYPNVEIVFPVHLNPNVQEPVNFILKNLKNVHLIPPLTYVPFLFMMKNCFLIVTDSGGVQEEAPSFGKPVLVIRENTERPEGVKAGVVRLIGTNRENIISEVGGLLENSNKYKKMQKKINPYGDGKASERIIRILKEKK